MVSNSWVLALYGVSTLFASSEAVTFRLPVKSREVEEAETKWGTIWTAAPQLVEPDNLPPEPFGSSTDNLVDATLRQTIQISLPADQIRLQLSNAFGTKDLTIDAVTVALPVDGVAGGSGIQADTVQALTFDGNDSVTIPQGEMVWSDELDFRVETQQVLAISSYSWAGATTGAVTGHPGSRTNSWLAIGDQTADGNLTGSEATNMAHWHFISALEAQVPIDSKVLGIIGDSITDGRGTDDDKNNRWPDLLFARLQEENDTSNIAIANQGIGGNCVLSSECLGPGVLDRVDRDIFSLSSLGYIIIFEGVNDIGSATSTSIADDLIEGYQQIITKARESDIPIFGATITPILGSSYGGDIQEEARQIVNEWIRNSVTGDDVGFDGIADFDKVLSDPSKPGYLKPEYDSGDYLHPNVAGYQAIADEFPVDIFG